MLITDEWLLTTSYTFLNVSVLTFNIHKILFIHAFEFGNVTSPSNIIRLKAT